tara:strand:+ start:425 stop:841 length:417 start_codon:yes stop_codon:yes gene_type:complete
MSTIKTNTLTGTTSAGSIVVTGEGGSTTTNLQQGLIKVWTFYDVDSDGIHDSFNTASFTDTGSGSSTIAYTNNMNSVNYAPMGGSTHDSGTYGCYMPLNHDDPPTTSDVKFDHMQPYSASGTRVDQELATLQVTGDLA